MRIRPELPSDAPAIAALIGSAFADAEHSDGNEAAIVEGLREGGALAVSLVAVEDGGIIGHVAFSPVRIEGHDAGWFGLGPVAVEPQRQRCGIGESLINDGLTRLHALGAHGCVVLGDPAYYGRFGFVFDDRLRYPGPPAQYFQALVLAGPIPTGNVSYHPAFDG